MTTTIKTITEKQFRDVWVSMLWRAMATTGKGYRRPSLRHTGKNGDRRQDKIGTTKLQRRLAQYQTFGA